MALSFFLLLSLLLLPNAFAFSTLSHGHHGHHTDTSHNYRDALTKSILFFEGQRSGKLPASQRMHYRGDSGLSDGSSMNVRKIYSVSFWVFIFQGV